MHRRRRPRYANEASRGGRPLASSAPLTAARSPLTNTCLPTSPQPSHHPRSASTYFSMIRDNGQIIIWTRNVVSFACRWPCDSPVADSSAIYRPPPSLTAFHHRGNAGRGGGGKDQISKCDDQNRIREDLRFITDGGEVHNFPLGGAEFALKC